MATHRFHPDRPLRMRRAPMQNTIQEKHKSTDPGLSAVSETFMVNTNVPPDTVLDLIWQSTQFPGAQPSGNKRLHRCQTRIAGNRFQITRNSRLNRFNRVLHGAVYPTPRGSRIEYTLATNPTVRAWFSIFFAVFNVFLLAGIATVIISGAQSSSTYELVAVPIVMMVLAMAVAAFGLKASRKGEAELEQFIRTLDPQKK